MFKDENIPIKIPDTETIPVPIKTPTPENVGKIEEIDQALKQFEAQVSVAPVVAEAQVAPASDLSFMVRLVMKLSGGAIQTKRSAEYVLLFLTILFFVLSFLISFGGSFFNKATLTQISTPKGPILP